MTAGLNLKATVYRLTPQADDRIGGSVPSGTAVYTDLPCSLAQDQPAMAFKSQGRETPTTYSFTTRGSLQDFVGAGAAGYQGIRENDEVVITWPAQSQYYQVRFLVTSQQESTRRRNRYGHVHLKLSRIRTSRLNQFP